MAQPEQRKLHRRQVPRWSRAVRTWSPARTKIGRGAKSRAGWGRSKFRHRGVSENLSVNGSARRRLPAQVNTGNVAEVRRLDFVNR